MGKVKPILIIIITVILIAIVYFVRQKPPAQKIKSPVKTILPDIRYSAWIPDWEEARSLDSIENGSASKLGQILPVWYTLDSSGGINENLTKNSGLILETAKAKGIKVTPTIVNTGTNGFDPNRVTQMLDTNNENAINYLVDTAQKRKYDGWDLDFENLSKQDRGKYTLFVKNLSEKLHSKRLTLSVTVHSQETEKDNWKGVLGQDIENLGKYSDQIRIMAYDFHNTDTVAGPITPILDLEKTIKFTISKVDPAKIVIGLPTYGYDWENRGNTTPYQYKEIKALLELKRANVVRDIDTGELKSSYENHQIWYLDAASLLKLKEIVNSYEIDKICFWHLGGEDERIWGKL